MVSKSYFLTVGRLLVLVMLVILGLTEWALIQYVKRHLWIVPTVVASNILICWLILNILVLRSIVFPYGQSFILTSVQR